MKNGFVKATLFLLLTFVSGVMLSSCFKSSYDEALAKEIDEEIRTSDFQRKLPMRLNQIVTWTKMERVDKYVTYFYDINENYQTMSTVRSNAEKMREGAIAAMKFDPIFEKCKKCGLGFKWVYKGSKTGEEFEFSLEPEDFK